MSTAIKINEYLNSFFKLKLQDADKELYNTIRDKGGRTYRRTERTGTRFFKKPCFLFCCWMFYMCFFKPLYAWHMNGIDY